MEGLARLFILLIVLLLAYGIGCIGRRRKIGFGWAFGFSLIHPLIGLIVTLCSSKKNKKEFIDIN